MAMGRRPTFIILAGALFSATLADALDALRKSTHRRFKERAGQANRNRGKLYNVARTILQFVQFAPEGQRMCYRQWIRAGITKVTYRVCCTVFFLKWK